MSKSSDQDEESYQELMQESAKTGKSIQQILTERTGKTWVEVNLEDKKKATKEIREFLSKNTWIIKPKTEEKNE